MTESDPVTVSVVCPELVPLKLGDLCLFFLKLLALSIFASPRYPELTFPTPSILRYYLLVYYGERATSSRLLTVFFPLLILKKEYLQYV